MSERAMVWRSAETDSCSAWTPLLLGTGLALAFLPGDPPWTGMWVLAAVIFAGFKWLTYRRSVVDGVPTSRRRALTYLFLWPGMDARTFLDIRRRAAAPPIREWAAGAGKLAFGAALIWGMARASSNELVAGWIGMIGAILLLHCGLFHLLANFWRWRGVCAKPLMRMPIAAGSVSEFWGRRWNVAFQEIAFGAFFLPLRGRVGAVRALMGTFFISGIIHDVVISIPAGAGYGLPTLYFSLQGAALIAEHRHRRWFRAHRGLNRVFAWAVIAGPAGLLFPPVFVERVILPLLKATGAL